MKSTFLLIGLSASLSSANIIFSKIQPLCDILQVDFTGCLRGQICQEDNTCVLQMLSSSMVGLTLGSDASLPAKVRSPHLPCPLGPLVPRPDPYLEPYLEPCPEYYRGLEPCLAAHPETGLEAHLEARPVARLEARLEAHLEVHLEAPLEALPYLHRDLRPENHLGQACQVQQSPLAHLHQ